MGIREGRIFWKKDDAALDATIRLLFGIENGVPIETAAVKHLGRTVQENIFKFPTDWSSIPFGYRIRHKEDEFRQLTVCHPRNQLQLVDFYNSYKETHPLPLQRQPLLNTQAR